MASAVKSSFRHFAVLFLTISRKIHRQVLPSKFTAVPSSNGCQFYAFSRENLHVHFSRLCILYNVFTKQFSSLFTRNLYFRKIFSKLCVFVLKPWYVTSRQRHLVVQTCKNWELDVSNSRWKWRKVWTYLTQPWTLFFTK